MTRRLRIAGAWRGPVLLVLTAASLGAAGQAGARPLDPSAQDCLTGAGVLVVVDFGDGEVQSGCAPGDPDSGEAAMRTAGFEITNNQSGLVCQIDAFPPDCPASPPLDAYWSYWHAELGADGSVGQWSYSSVGAGTHDPAPGTVQGWRFGGRDDEPPPADEVVATTTAAGPSAPDSGPAPADATGAVDGGQVEGSSPLPTVLAVGTLALGAAALGGWRWSRRRHR